MESEYLLEITHERRSTRYRNEAARQAADEASQRIHKKCAKGVPYVAIHIKNPRFVARA